MSTAQKGKTVASHATNVENEAILFSKAQRMRRKKIQHFGYNHSAPFLRDLSTGHKLFQRHEQHASLTDVIHHCFL